MFRGRRSLFSKSPPRAAARRRSTCPLRQLDQATGDHGCGATICPPTTSVRGFVDQTSFPTPGAVLWAVDVELNREVLRSGAATHPAANFLRYTDIGVAQLGRIEGDEQDKHVIEPGRGVSLFLLRMPAPGWALLNDNNRSDFPKDKQKKVIWWSIDQGHPIPSGLVLIYDGQPPGHCTLSPTRPMTVAAFLALVALVPFTQTGFDWAGKL